MASLEVVAQNLQSAPVADLFTLVVLSLNLSVCHGFLLALQRGAHVAAFFGSPGERRQIRRPIVLLGLPKLALDRKVGSSGRWTGCASYCYILSVACLLNGLQRIVLTLEYFMLLLSLASVGRCNRKSLMALNSNRTL